MVKGSSPRYFCKSYIYICTQCCYNIDDYIYILQVYFISRKKLHEQNQTSSTKSHPTSQCRPFPQASVFQADNKLPKPPGAFDRRGSSMTTYKGNVKLLRGEIPHQLVGSSSNYLQGFYTSLVGGEYLSSTVSVSTVHQYFTN